MCVTELPFIEGAVWPRIGLADREGRAPHHPPRLFDLAPRIWLDASMLFLFATKYSRHLRRQELPEVGVLRPYSCTYSMACLAGAHPLTCPLLNGVALLKHILAGDASAQHYSEASARCSMCSWILPPHPQLCHGTSTAMPLHGTTTAMLLHGALRF
jgi:hypothetical protein